MHFHVLKPEKYLSKFKKKKVIFVGFNNEIIFRGENRIFYFFVDYAKFKMRFFAHTSFSWIYHANFGQNGSLRGLWVLPAMCWGRNKPFLKLKYLL
jgi:hypothetical protein